MASVSTYPEVIDLANEYLRVSGMTKEKFAKSVNYSRTAVSQYLSGNYTSDVAGIELAILRYLDEVGFYGPDVKDVQSNHNIVVNMFDDDFYVTEDAKNMMAACQASKEVHGLGIITGKTGYGKSYTLKRFGKLNRVCYIECDDSMGCRDLVEAIESNLGLPQGYGTIWKRVKAIKEFFNVNTGYLLIIDEADKLITKYTQKKIEILRTIFDQSDLGLVIAGEPALESLIKGYLPRFANRVDFYVQLKGLSRREAIEYSKSRLKGYEITAEAMEELIVRGINYHTGCFRLLNRTLNNVARLLSDNSSKSNGETQKVTLDIIDKASRMMML